MAAPSMDLIAQALINLKNGLRVYKSIENLQLGSIDAKSSRKDGCTWKDKPVDNASILTRL